MKLRARLQAKLRARRGVTLTEMLVALAILSLVLTVVIVGIGAAGNVHRDSTKVSRSQMLLSTLSQAVSDELRFARDIPKGGAGNPTYTSANFGQNATLGVNDKGQLAVKSGEKDPMALVGSGVYGKNTADIAVEYLPGEACFRVTLTVKDGTDVLRNETFYVRALNPPT